MLSRFIIHYREEIQRHCEQDLALRYPDRPQDELTQYMNTFLDEVVMALEKEENGHVRPLVDTAAREHGVLRSRQGLDINRVVHDYSLVCDSITDACRFHGFLPSVRDVQVMNRCVDEATAYAVEAYCAERERARQAESAERIGSLAHEVRNAVCTATMAFELIRRGKIGPSGSTGDALDRALKRITDLVGRSLDEAKALGGTMAVREKLSVHRLLANVVVEHARTDVHVETAVHGPLRFVDGDERLLSSALGNLVQNAVKFTHPGTTVFVRALAIEGAVRFEVEDRCGGLPPHAAEHMFRPFVQNSGDQRGVGLGLAIARRAAEAHGGTIGVTSLPGVGCIFAVTIPTTPRVIERSEGSAQAPL